MRWEHNALEDVPHTWAAHILAEAIENFVFEIELALKYEGESA